MSGAGGVNGHGNSDSDSLGESRRALSMGRKLNIPSCYFKRKRVMSVGFSGRTAERFRTKLTGTPDVSTLLI